MRGILWKLGLMTLVIWSLGAAPSALADEDLCADFTQPGCVESGCAQGESCDTTVGCVPSFCSCDPATGQVICTADCDGGTCVPAEPTCCDPADEPGTGDIPICIEGATCCADGSWSCNDGAGRSTCDVDGEVCEEEDLCADFTAPGCTQAGCLPGQTCNTSVGCNPSFCSCDPDTGQVVCTADCSGGTCVPEPTNALLALCALLTLATLRITEGWRARRRLT